MAVSVNQLEVEASGLRFETLVAGPEDGEAVILLHGYPQNAGAWESTVGWLAGRGYRAIAPSLRGYSPGANPAEASAFSMGNLVGDVVGIADALGVGRFHLVGHDWGGALAWMVAGAHRDRLLSLTVLSTPHPAAMRKAMRNSTQMLRSSYMGFFRIPRVPEAMLRFRNFSSTGLAMRMSGLPKESWKRDRAHLERVGLRGPLNWYRGAAVAMGRPPRITTPTLFIWGRHDFFLGRKAAEMTAQFISGEYRFVDLDAGHWIAERNSHQLHRLLGEHLEAHREQRATAAPSAAATPEPAATAADAGPNSAPAPAPRKRAKRASKPPADTP